MTTTEGDTVTRIDTPNATASAADLARLSPLEAVLLEAKAARERGDAPTWAVMAGLAAQLTDDPAIQSEARAARKIASLFQGPHPAWVQQVTHPKDAVDLVEGIDAFNAWSAGDVQGAGFDEMRRVATKQLTNEARAAGREA
ncbi:MAG: hypothetical protein IPJ34_22560 [Myxococcales bacterium]|nr:hypothetical protein [Myxococcales bacterium]